MALSIIIKKWCNEEYFEEEKEVHFSQVEFELLIIDMKCQAS